MGFLRSGPGVALLLLAALGTLGTGLVASDVYRATHPPRVVEQASELTEAVVPVEPVEIVSTDGVRLSGWLLEGGSGAPGVVLCHAAGRGKGSMLEIAVLLHDRGFNILAFDFRGHGQSEGRGTSLGLAEKRDVIGAVDFLSPVIDGAPIGVYGVGMGAHAAVLAAAERNEIRVLVLDALYPEPAWPLIREVYGGWSAGSRWLGFLPGTIYGLMHLPELDQPPASELLAELRGREVLLLAPADDVELSAEIERMFDTIPEQQGAETNLVTLPSSGHGAMYGEDLALYRQRVASFFESRMVR